MHALVVDDDREIRTALVAAIRIEYGEMVDTAESGEEAMGFAVSNSYDLVTLDINMPGVSGLDILGTLRTLLPWSVIAIISGTTEEITSATLGGAAALVLSKPFSAAKIRSIAKMAKELLAKREEIQALTEWNTPTEEPDE